MAVESDTQSPSESGAQLSMIEKKDTAELQSLPSPVAGDAEEQVMSTAKRILIVVTIGLVIFLGSLDSTIVGTIVPTITAEFNSGQDIGWYGSIFLLMTGATQPIYGKLYTIFRQKLVFLVSVAFLLAGSLVCALARNSPTFIAGRAFAGLGCAGVLSGGLTITALITPLQQRPLYTSILGALEAVGTVVGPTIGGALAHSIGWRWCFWINLPVGGLLYFVLVFFFHPPRAMSADTGTQSEHKTTLQKLMHADLFGGFVITGSLTCLLLALQWGGNEYPWSNGRIIALLIVFGVSFILVGWYEHRRGDAAIFPTRLFKNKSFVASLFFGFCVCSAQFAVIYYLPTWFQAVQRVSVFESGIRILPMMISCSVIDILFSIGCSKIGILPPFLMTATVLASVGTGLIYSFYPTIPQPNWIGYQVIVGGGFGAGIQQSIIGVQAALDNADIAYGTSAIMLGNVVGGAIFIGVTQSLFLAEVTKMAKSIPSVPLEILMNDFHGVEQYLSADELAIAVDGYNQGLRKGFLAALILCCATVLSWPFVSWKSIKTKDRKQNTDIEPVEVVSAGTDSISKAIRTEKEPVDVKASSS